MDKASPLALADFLNEYRRDNVTSVSCANLMDAAAEELRSGYAEIKTNDRRYRMAQDRANDDIERLTDTAHRLKRINAGQASLLAQHGIGSQGTQNGNCSHTGDTWTAGGKTKCCDCNEPV